MSRTPRPLPAASSLPAEVLLVAVTVASLLGGLRLLQDGSFLAPVIGTALLAHVLVALVRRAGRGVGLSTLVSLVGVAALQLWVHYPHTTLYGLPRRATLEALSDDFAGAWEVVASSRVPVATQTGLVVGAAAIAWLMPVLADWAAFRVGVRGEALAPAGIVLVIVSLFGTDEGRILYPTLLVICAVAFGLAHQHIRSPKRRQVSGPEGRRPRRPRGLLAGALAVAGGVLVTAALLPVLSDGPLRTLLDPEATPSEDGRKVVLSPLVSLPGQLLQNPGQELFTVRSNQRAYWRLTALGDFDGTVWSLDETTGSATDSLMSLAATTGPVTEVTQTYRIGRLAAVWLPAAYQPVGFEAAGASFRASFEPVSSTLLVGSAHRDSDGLGYTVRSAVPSFEPAFLESLRNDPASVPPGFTELPADLSPVLAELAAAVTEGRAGPYEQALALQDWFRSGFEYDLEVAPGHSSSRLEEFLLAERKGYCEQFAGAFATLARTLGSPWGSPRVSRRRPAAPAARSTASGESTPTPGRRSSSAAPDGWRSSRPRGAARPGRRPTRSSPSSRTPPVRPRLQPSPRHRRRPLPPRPASGRRRHLRPPPASPATATARPSPGG